VLSTVISVFIALATRHMMVRPIARVIAASRRIAAGDLTEGAVALEGSDGDGNWQST
jgi:nitrogen fixation/metabolism regulation signal transduction histidine kinase